MPADRHTEAAAGASPTTPVTAIVLLALAGVGLRVTILAVPPVVPMLHADLGLGETGIAVLSSLPALMFAWAAIPGSALIARFGALRTLVIGLLLTAAASALRGAAPGSLLLFGATLLMGLGVAIMQPSLPPLVRAWLPHRIGFGTAVYTSGLLLGELLGVWLTIPYILPLAGGSWRLAFAIWAIPVAATALLVGVLGPRRGIAAPAGTVRLWWPDWRSPLLWRLGLILGSVNTIYFATNTFLPDYLTYIGRPETIGAALTGLNLGQIPASFLMLLFAGKLARRPSSYVVSGLLTLIGLVGMVAMSDWIVVWAGVVGFADAVTLVLVLALPALLCPSDDVPRVSAGMFTISYHWAVIVPIVGGLAWDSTGSPFVAFALIGLGAVVVMVLTPTIDFKPVISSRRFRAWPHIDRRRDREQG
jgi:MFS transporter, CP family, cyanate transporter